MTPKLDKHQRLELLLARHPRGAGDWIKYGWFYPEGQMRFGWWIHHADGSGYVYLGRTFAEAEKALQSPTC